MEWERVGIFGDNGVWSIQSQSMRAGFEMGLKASEGFEGNREPLWSKHSHFCGQTTCSARQQTTLACVTKKHHVRGIWKSPQGWRKDWMTIFPENTEMGSRWRSRQQDPQICLFVRKVTRRWWCQSAGENLGAGYIWPVPGLRDMSTWVLLMGQFNPVSNFCYKMPTVCQAPCWALEYKYKHTSKRQMLSSRPWNVKNRWGEY